MILGFRVDGLMFCGCCCGCGSSWWRARGGCDGRPDCWVRWRKPSTLSCTLKCILTVSGRALNPTVRIDHPKINDPANCLPVLVRQVFLDWFFSNFCLTSKICSTPTMGKQSQIIIFSGGLNTAGYRALSETAW